MTTRTYTNRSNAVRAAKAALGPTALSDVHFKITQDGDEFAWVAMDLETGRPTDSEESSLEATQRKADGPATALDALDSGDTVAVAEKPDPLVVNGRRYGNATRAAEARKALERKAEKTAPKAPVLGQRAQVEADACEGKVPTAPDFTAETHKAYRKRLAEVVALVEARNIKGLKDYPIPTPGSSGKALARYRNLAVIALEAQEAKA